LLPIKVSLFDSDHWMILLSNKDQCLSKGLGATYVKLISNYIQYIRTTYGGFIQVIKNGLE